MIYVGQHQTENLDDGYMGSGLRIQRAIEKYGIDNFEKTILFECSSEEEMNKKEAEIVNEDFIARDDVYNITLGGHGGWNYVNQTCHNNKHNHRRTGWLSIDSNGENASYRKIKNYSTDEFELHCKKISEGLKQHYVECGSHWTGKRHKPETIQKISNSAKTRIGTKNNQFGTMWICNDETHESKKILKSNKIPDGWRAGRFCK